MDAHIAKYKKMTDSNIGGFFSSENTSSNDWRGKVGDQEKSIGGSTSLKEINMAVETFEVDNSKTKHSYQNQNKNSQLSSERANNSYSASFLSITKFFNSPKVRSVICPFDDSSHGVQTCYKICAGVTCFIVILVFYLMLVYK